MVFAALTTDWSQKPMRMILAILFACVSNLAFAADGQKVKSLVDAVYKSKPGTFTTMRRDGPDKRGFRIVYEHADKRYTFDHNWWVDGIQVWVRPKGTTDISSVDGLADKNMDGKVDMGSDSKRIFVRADFFSWGNPQEGGEHEKLWQQVYDDALVGLETVMRRKR